MLLGLFNDTFIELSLASAGLAALVKGRKLQLVMRTFVIYIRTVLWTEQQRTIYVSIFQQRIARGGSGTLVLNRTKIVRYKVVRSDKR